MRPLYSSLSLLHDPSLSKTDPDHIQYSLALLKPVAEETVDSGCLFLTGSRGVVENPSPLLIHWAYQAATIYSRLIRETGRQDLGPLEKLKLKLRILARRWMAAGMRFLPTTHVGLR